MPLVKLIHICFCWKLVAVYILIFIFNVPFIPLIISLIGSVQSDIAGKPQALLLELLKMNGDETVVDLLC